MEYGTRNTETPTESAYGFVADTLQTPHARTLRAGARVLKTRSISRTTSNQAAHAETPPHPAGVAPMRLADGHTTPQSLHTPPTTTSPAHKCSACARSTQRRLTPPLSTDARARARSSPCWRPSGSVRHSTSPGVRTPGSLAREFEVPAKRLLGLGWTSATVHSRDMDRVPHPQVCCVAIPERGESSSRLCEGCPQDDLRFMRRRTRTWTCELRVAADAQGRAQPARDVAPRGARKFCARNPAVSTPPRCREVALRCAETWREAPDGAPGATTQQRLPATCAARATLQSRDSICARGSQLSSPETELRCAGLAANLRADALRAPFPYSYCNPGCSNGCFLSPRLVLRDVVRKELSKERLRTGGRGCGVSATARSEAQRVIVRGRLDFSAYFSSSGAAGSPSGQTVSVSTLFQAVMASPPASCVSEETENGGDSEGAGDSEEGVCGWARAPLYRKQESLSIANRPRRDVRTFRGAESGADVAWGEYVVRSVDRHDECLQREERRGLCRGKPGCRTCAEGREALSEAVKALLGGVAVLENWSGAGGRQDVVGVRVQGRRQRPSGSGTQVALDARDEWARRRTSSAEGGRAAASARQARTGALVGAADVVGIVLASDVGCLSCGEAHGSSVPPELDVVRGREGGAAASARRRERHERGVAADVGVVAGDAEGGADVGAHPGTPTTRRRGSFMRGRSSWDEGGATDVVGGAGDAEGSADVGGQWLLNSGAAPVDSQARDWGRADEDCVSDKVDSAARRGSRMGGGAAPDVVRVHIRVGRVQDRLLGRRGDWRCEEEAALHSCRVLFAPSDSIGRRRPKRWVSAADGLCAPKTRADALSGSSAIVVFSCRQPRYWSMLLGVFGRVRRRVGKGRVAGRVAGRRAMPQEWEVYVVYA
ncbi:hypothetical protein B0H17DRAFT_1129220 [Mycena rosella]|uniref:Uncharacterized protein n=1 Tax=Mycena rosella TaxID=1033263 RepID=A0AAD7GQB6_MYCRO|nr:hypothetical protein B0H17DRAFT_1129220 [Mycena rosella]